MQQQFVTDPSGFNGRYAVTEVVTGGVLDATTGRPVLPVN